MSRKSGCSQKGSKISAEGKKDEVKLQIREERLDITKKLVQTAEVSVHKEVLTEERSFTVPVTREDIVIEKKVLNTESTGKKDEHIETIRIPVSEEYIEVFAHPVILSEVEIYRQQFTDIQHIEETLKKEKLHINTKGNLKVYDEDNAKR